MRRNHLTSYASSLPSSASTASSQSLQHPMMQTYLIAHTELSFSACPQQPRALFAPCLPALLLIPRPRRRRGRGLPPPHRRLHHRRRRSHGRRSFPRRWRCRRRLLLQLPRRTRQGDPDRRRHHQRPAAICQPPRRLHHARRPAYHRPHQRLHLKRECHRQGRQITQKRVEAWGGSRARRVKTIKYKPRRTRRVGADAW
jgi:hypothetical protein